MTSHEKLEKLNLQEYTRLKVDELRYTPPVKRGCKSILSSKEYVSLTVRLNKDINDAVCGYPQNIFDNRSATTRYLIEKFCLVKAKDHALMGRWLDNLTYKTNMVGNDRYAIRIKMHRGFVRYIQSMALECSMDTNALILYMLTDIIKEGKKHGEIA